MKVNTTKVSVTIANYDSIHIYIYIYMYAYHILATKWIPPNESVIIDISSADSCLQLY